MDKKYIMKWFIRFMGVYLLLGLVSFLWSWGFMSLSASEALTYADHIFTLEVSLVVSSAVTLYLVVLSIYVKGHQ